MRNRRNDWLKSLSHDEFVHLDPWVFINHEDSRCQWIAEVRSKLRVSMTDDEIISILNLGLYECVRRAIANNQTAPAENRGAILIGSALQFIRLKGVAKVFDEIPGSNALSLADIEASVASRRSHDLQDDYHTATSAYAEALEVAPVFLADGIVLADSVRQVQHRHIEQIRSLLTSREHQLLRLLLIDGQTPSAICEILDLSQKQVGKIRRGLKHKLCEIAVQSGLDQDAVARISGSSL